MAFCKVCACGNKIVFERRLSFPDKCPSCGRRLVDYLTYSEDDPRVDELLKATHESAVDENNVEGNVAFSENHKKHYALRITNEIEIVIPEEGCIIGRTEQGAEELSEYPSISRQHLRITPKRNIGVLIEDISKYGTLVDGQRIEKNTPVRVAEGSKITLCNVDTLLVAKEASE